MGALRKPEGFENYRSVSELASYLGVSTRTIERWWSEGVIADGVIRTESGMKLWGPEQARKALEYRMLRLPSVRYSRRRINR